MYTFSVKIHGSKNIFYLGEKHMEIVTKYLGIHKEESTVALHYLNSDELAREYVFVNEKDAEDFYNTCKNLDEFMDQVPEEKREIYHNELLANLFKGKEYELNIYDASTAEVSNKEI
jgi:phosphopantetheine adenylyltransferase